MICSFDRSRSICTGRGQRLAAARGMFFLTDAIGGNTEAGDEDHDPVCQNVCASPLLVVSRVVQCCCELMQKCRKVSAESCLIQIQSPVVRDESGHGLCLQSGLGGNPLVTVDRQFVLRWEVYFLTILRGRV